MDGDEQVDGTAVQFSLHLFPRNSQIRNIIIIRYTVPDFLHIGQQMLIGVEIRTLSQETMASTLLILRTSQWIDTFFNIS
jgi:hypothetical protein